MEAPSTREPRAGIRDVLCPIETLVISMKFAFILGSDSHLSIAREIVESTDSQKLASLAISLKPYFYGGSDFTDEALRAISDKAVRPLVDEIYNTQNKSVFRKFFRRATCIITKGSFLVNPKKCKTYSEFFPIEQKDLDVDFAFICNDRSEVERFWCREFQRRHIPVFLVQESIRRDLSMLQKANYPAHGQGATSHIFAWGRSSREYYLRAGVPESRISVTGSPRMDRFLRDFKAVESCVPNRRQERESAAPTVLLCSNPVYSMFLKEPLSFDAYLGQVDTVASWCDSIGCQFVWKPHPLERNHLSAKIIDEFRRRHSMLYYAPEMTLEEGLAQASVVLINNSTVAVESALARRPCGMLFSSIYGHGTDFIDRGICLDISSLKDFHLLLNNGMQEYPKPTVDWYIDARPGSAQRILEECNRLVTTKKDLT